MREVFIVFVGTWLTLGLSGLAGLLIRAAVDPRGCRISVLLPSWVGPRQSGLLGIICMILALAVFPVFRLF